MDLMRIASGEDRSFTASLLRAAAFIAEPIYTRIVELRNGMYDSRMLKTHQLAKPTISVGNITTGGTGKTPMVRWLAEQLIARGHRPAVLMRGYGSDEPKLLRDWLGDRAQVIANPDRVAGALSATQADVFILDDGFQHRQVARDFNLVLIDATNPFGFGHVLPRGLLREPLRGLARAHAILITRSDQVDAAELQSIQAQLPQIPMYHARHAHVALRDRHAAHSMDLLAHNKFVLFSGIGNPQSLERQLSPYSANLLRSRAFGDHHAYAQHDLDELNDTAADVLVTTEKDWVKIEPFSSKKPILRIEMRMEIDRGDELLKTIESSLGG